MDEPPNGKPVNFTNEYSYIGIALRKLPLQHNDENGATGLSPSNPVSTFPAAVTAPEHRKALAPGCCWPTPLSPRPSYDTRMAEDAKRKNHSRVPGGYIYRLCMMNIKDTLHALFSCNGSKNFVTLCAMLRKKCTSSGELMGNM